MRRWKYIREEDAVGINVGNLFIAIFFFDDAYSNDFILLLDTNYIIKYLDNLIP